MVAQARTKTTTTRPAKSPRGKSKKLSESLVEVASSEVPQEKKAILLGESRGFEELEIALINRESQTQPRGKLDTETIESYADSMLEEYDKFPPVVVFYDGTNHYLADGFHRVASAEKNQRKTIKSDIRTGSLEEARWFSYSANSRQGLRRTNEDKRRAVESALQHPNAINMSDVALAKHLGVSENTVKKYRDLLNVEKPETRKVTKEVNGKKISYEQKVSSEKRSEAQKNKKNNNQFEYWERDDIWEIAIPGDLLNAKIKVNFMTTPTGVKFTFSDRKEALLSDTEEISFSEQEIKKQQKEFATPYLFAQYEIMRWVKEKEAKRKSIFDIKDKGFYPGVRVTHRIFGEGIISKIQETTVSVKYDLGSIVEEPISDLLSLVPIKEFEIGQKVRVVKRDMKFWPANDEVVVVREKIDTRSVPSYFVGELNPRSNKKGEDVSKAEVVPWWQIEKDEPQNLVEEVDVKQGEPDYYVIAIGCLTNLPDDDLLKLKAALDREIKLRNLEPADDLQKFQSELVQYAASQGKSSPEGWAHTVIKNHKNGEISPLWEDFIAGRELGSGSSIKREWEIEPGIPYTAFKEERIQYYIAKGEPIESATLKAGNDLRNPKIAQDLWSGFLRKSNRQADEALKQKEMGVQTPYLPPSFHTKEITKEEVEVKLNLLVQQQEQQPQPQLEGGTSSSSDNDNYKPTIESLQTCLDSPFTKGIAIKRIQDNPQWGYAIEGDKVVVQGGSND